MAVELHDPHGSLPRMRRPALLVQPEGGAKLARAAGNFIEVIWFVIVYSITTLALVLLLWPLLSKVMKKVVPTRQDEFAAVRPVD